LDGFHCRDQIEKRRERRGLIFGAIRRNDLWHRIGPAHRYEVGNNWVAGLDVAPIPKSKPAVFFDLVVGTTFSNLRDIARCQLTMAETKKSLFLQNWNKEGPWRKASFAHAEGD
jgi:hypothetical protein